MTIYAPFINQVGNVESYISPTELKFSPTASALDLADLVQTGGQAANDLALIQLIKRASGMADAFCYGKMGTLNATINTENGRYNTDRLGRVKIHPKYTPIIGISSFEYGQNAGTLTPLALTTGNAWIEEEELVIIPSGSVGTVVYSGTDTLSNLTQGETSGWGYYCQWSYINGWANTFTTSTTVAGSTTMSVVDGTGLYPGVQTTIFDGMNEEIVTLASTYVAGSSSLVFTSGTLYKHGSNVNVSRIHQNIKQAVVHLVCSLVKERSQGGGFEISPAGEVIQTSGKSKGFSDDEIQAYNLLDEFQCISGRT